MLMTLFGSALSRVTLVRLMARNEPVVMIPGGHLACDVIDAPAEWSMVPEKNQYLVCGQGRKSLYRSK